MPRRRRRGRPRPRRPSTSARPAAARPGGTATGGRRTGSPPTPSAEERRLLALARRLTELGAAPGVGPAQALRALVPDRGPATAADKTRTLAVGWAREQARLALEDLLARAAPRGRAAAPAVPLPLLTWLLVAATGAFATEPAEALGERLAALAERLVTGREPERW